MSYLDEVRVVGYTGIYGQFEPEQAAEVVSFTAEEVEEAFCEGVKMARRLAHWSTRDMFNDSETATLIQERAVMGGGS